MVHHKRLKPYLSSTYQLGQTVSDASFPNAQPVEREVPTSTSNSSTLAVQENLPSVVFTGEVPSQSPARSLLLRQSLLNLTQNTGQFTVTQPDDMDTVSSKVDHPTMAPHGVLDPRLLGSQACQIACKV